MADLDPEELQVIRFADLVVTRWQNGGGETREILSAPDPTGPRFLWRVSVADINGDGPFSVFPRVHRVAVLVGEAPELGLTMHGAETMLEPYTPFAFSGEVVTSARLPKGPVQLLNVMTQHERVTATVTIARGDGLLKAPPGEEARTLLVVLRGDAIVAGAEGTTTALGPLDTVRLPGAQPLELVGDDLVAAVVVLT